MTGPKQAFTFHCCLGEGGFGEVYLATQTTDGGIHREVAVKVLHERYDDASNAVMRLRDEGQVLAMLAHPNIVDVHGFTKIDGRLALVTEYVEGADLAAFCEPGELLPPRIAVDVAREVAEALDYALTVANPRTGEPLEMIHRDVKPANIRISTQGTVKLLDFGVARTQKMDRKARTAMGDVLLTSGYAAPEALGFGVSGPSVDVFALGVTLYRLLTGEGFYQDRDLKFQVTLALERDNFGRFLQERLAPIQPPELRELLAQMLVYDHTQRIGAAGVAEALERVHAVMDGPTTGAWARHRAWQLVVVPEASLTGKSFDGDGHIIEGAPPPVMPELQPEAPQAPVPPPPSFEGGGSRSVVPTSPRSQVPGEQGGAAAGTPRPAERQPPVADPVPAAPREASSRNLLWAGLLVGGLLLVGFTLVLLLVVAGIGTAWFMG